MKQHKPDIVSNMRSLHETFIDFRDHCCVPEYTSNGVPGLGSWRNARHTMVNEFGLSGEHAEELSDIAEINGTRNLVIALAAAVWMDHRDGDLCLDGLPEDFAKIMEKIAAKKRKIKVIARVTPKNK